MGNGLLHNAEIVSGNDIRGPADDRLLVKKDGRAVFVRTDVIDWIEARGNYLRVHWGSDVYLTRNTMKRIEGRLDPGKFVRIHRSTIVNTERVKGLRPVRDRWSVEMSDGSILMLSRSYRSRGLMLARGLTQLSSGHRTSQATD